MSKKYKYRHRETYNGIELDIKANNQVALGEKVARRKAEIDGEIRKVSGGTTVLEWVETFLETYKTAVSHRELLNLKNQLKNHILPTIGAIRVKDVKPLHCRQVMNKLEGKSTSYAKKIRSLLYSIFDAAEENDMTLKNPARRLSLPETYEGSRRNITEEERRVFLDVAKDHEYGLWLVIMLYTGCRPSETSRIKGKHIDLDGGKIFIDGTKSKNAKRWMFISDELKPWLMDLNIKSNEYLFETSAGNPIDDQRRTRMWKALKRAANIKMGCKVYRNKVIAPYWVAPDLTPDCFRHTFATDMQNNKINLNITANLLGHAHIKTTQGYTHMTDEAFEMARAMYNKGKKE